jgi:hypothetical protein
VTVDKRAAILRILDDQNRLVERADTKAISLLSTLGIFTVFFIAQFRSIPITPLSIVLVCIYFVSVLSSIIHIIMAISPRIRPTLKNGQSPTADEKSAFQPTFYAGICAFPDSSTYRHCLEGMLNEETSTTDTYIEQIYAVAKINDAKYRYVRRAVVLVVITLVAQLTLIAYTFADLMMLPQ